MIRCSLKVPARKGGAHAFSDDFDSDFVCHGQSTAELVKKPAEAKTAGQAVERSFSFLEKESVARVEKRKCTTCHHVPMML